ncbi:MAG: hypothetical protein OHM77_01130 [Candidatus Nitricoxidivorans perseverans]|uniref:AbrB/MazE/SpoVT family DNA-binding domain-containing protein n=1 Tax=Candidatus Nitricoxidivorans perseverans TaxID=2975601 RepID=A0AA49IZU7_9PROT|nr:MAG: hypothetical protein OHM77_01130 [Candidatus Nitricoxidivorans perseverans]
MKLRRIGNSLGTTFSKQLLNRAGFKGDDELEVAAVSGEIRIRHASSRLTIELTTAEAKALLEGATDTRAWKSAMNKVKKKVLA